jgi:hypothetical protein
MTSKNRRNLFDLLESVRQRPSMHLRRKSLLEVQTLCDGYAAALQIHCIEEAGTRFNRDFADYLGKRFKWSTCQGWARALGDHSRNSKEAFDSFFVLLAEFKEVESKNLRPK